MATRNAAAHRIVEAAGGFLVIVIGVLVALAADAWWNDREADTRRVTYLRALQSDLIATDAGLDSAIAVNDRSARASLALASVLLGSDSWEDLPDSVTASMGTDDVRFRTGMLTALLTTGDINHVRSDSLRVALISYAAEVDAAESFLAQTMLTLLDNFRDATRAEQALFEREASPELKRRLAGMGGAAALRRFDLQTLNGFPELQAAHFSHAVILFNRNEALALVRTSTQEVLRLLEMELEM